MLQFRPADSPHSVFYSPGRDLAYVGFDFINMGLDLLEKDLATSPQWLKEYLDKNGITEEQVRDGIKAFETSIYELCIEKGTVEHSFIPISKPVQLLVLYFIAKVFIGASIDGWKDVTSGEAVYALTPEEFLSKTFARQYAFSGERKAKFLEVVSKIYDKVTKFFSFS